MEQTKELLTIEEGVVGSIRALFKNTYFGDKRFFCQELEAHFPFLVQKYEMKQKDEFKDVLTLYFSDTKIVCLVEWVKSTTQTLNGYVLHDIGITR